VELSYTGCNLLGSLSFPDKGMTLYTFVAGEAAPAMKLACGKFHGGRGVVLGHAGGVCAKASSRRQYVEENEARSGFDGLGDCKGHEAV